VLLAGAGDSSSAITVRVDNEQAMRSLAEHFIDVHVIKRVGFVSGFDEEPRQRGPRGALSSRRSTKAATLADVDILKSDWTSAGGEGRMRATTGHGRAPLPEVFACANDQMAVGVIYALHDGGSGPRRRRGDRLSTTSR
jgi:LacI family transcriptional regulator